MTFGIGQSTSPNTFQPTTEHKPTASQKGSDGHRSIEEAPPNSRTFNQENTQSSSNSRGNFFSNATVLVATTVFTLMDNSKTVFADGVSGMNQALSNASSNLNETLANATEYGKQALTYASESLKEVTTQYLQRNTSMSDPETGGSDGLSEGAIAGIVIGTGLGVAGLAYGAYRAHQHYTAPSNPPVPNDASPQLGAAGDPEAAQEMKEPSEKTVMLPAEAAGGSADEGISGQAPPEQSKPDQPLSETPESTKHLQSHEQGAASDPMEIVVLTDDQEDKKPTGIETNT